MATRPRQLAPNVHLEILLRNGRRLLASTSVNLDALAKLLWHDGVGMLLYTKRLKTGKFI